MYVSIKGNIFVELLWRQRFFFIWSDRLGQGLAILRVTSAVVGQREATSLKLHSRVLTVISLTNATTNLAEWSSWDVGEEKFREIIREGACKEIRTQHQQLKLNARIFIHI